MAPEIILFNEKPHEEQQRITTRRKDALIQNKVLRALQKRGMTLRETFDFMDEDGSGEVREGERPLTVCLV